jgi:hypothetical protein
LGGDSSLRLAGAATHADASSRLGARIDDELWIRPR